MQIWYVNCKSSSYSYDRSLLESVFSISKVCMCMRSTSTKSYSVYLVTYKLINFAIFASMIRVCLACLAYDDL